MIYHYQSAFSIKISHWWNNILILDFNLCWSLVLTIRHELYLSGEIKGNLGPYRRSISIISTQHNSRILGFIKPLLNAFDFSKTRFNFQKKTFTYISIPYLHSIHKTHISSSKDLISPKYVFNICHPHIHNNYLQQNIFLLRQTQKIEANRYEQRWISTWIPMHYMGK